MEDNYTIIDPYVKLYYTCSNPCTDEDCPKCNGTNLAESLMSLSDLMKSFREGLMKEVREEILQSNWQCPVGSECDVVECPRVGIGACCHPSNLKETTK